MVPRRGYSERCQQHAHHRAERAGYHPEIILAGRRLNDNVGQHVARECLRLLLMHGRRPEPGASAWEDGPMRTDARWWLLGCFLVLSWLSHPPRLEEHSAGGTPGS